MVRAIGLLLRWGRLLILAGWSTLACPESAAQRVQLPPAGVAPVDPFGSVPSATVPWGGAPPPTSVYVPPPTLNPYAPAQPALPYSAPLAASPGIPGPYGAQGAVAAPALGASTPWPGAAPAAPVAPSYAYSAPPPSAGLYPDSAPLGWQPGTYGFEQSDGSVVRFRQFLARLRAEHTLLLGDNTRDGLTVNRTEVASTFALPVAGSIESPLLVTPGFAFNWFDGPNAAIADLPPRTYDAYLDFGWFPQWTPELGAELGFRTGVWTDFDEVNSDSVRILGRGLGVVSLTPQFDILLGAVYLDRLRVKTLPAGGVRWRPTPEWDLYLVFPNPKIRRSWLSSGSADWWWYVAGEYGGGSWTVNRATTGRDQFDYNDIRFVLGIEWQTPTQARGHLEIGYVFDRELRFKSNLPSRFKTDDAVMFRAGIGF